MADSQRQAGVSNSVKLPGRRRESQTQSSKPPVWSVERADECETEPPIDALCSKHSRGVCCRELKGSDERTLLDPDIVRDAIIGLSDGLTVPFALTAGLASLGSSRIVVLGGIAELISGAISMGLGGFLASEAERSHFRYLKRATHERVQRSCAGEMERETHAILSPLGLEQSLSRRVAGALLKVEADFVPKEERASSRGEPSFFRTLANKIARTPSDLKHANGNGHLQRTDMESQALKIGGNDADVGMTAFLLKFGEGLEEVPTSRLWISALTIGLAYFFGGLIPLLPYFVEQRANVALVYSIIVTGITLLLFGCFKAYFTGGQIGFAGYFKASLSTLAVGGLAAAAAWGIVRTFE